MLHVTKSFLPDIKEYISLLEEIWINGQLTNDGPLVLALERKLAEYLEVDNLLYVSNGTIALQLAIKALALEGDVITTPFSYCATTTSLIWEKCNPIFADISPVSLTSEREQIEKVINADSKGILTTHVYGNCADLTEQEQLAADYQIPIIYDGAHAFGVQHKGKSIFNFGTVSTCSFHATKIFHTIEGGAIITRDAALADKLRGIRSFGHKGDDYFAAGINGKNSEFHAAMGLVNLKHFAEIKDHRKSASELYESNLPANIQKFTWNSANSRNYSYFPVIFPSEEILLKVIKALNDVQIFPRRYFYPALNELPYLTYQACPVAEDIAKRIVCLPLSAEISAEAILQICSIISSTL
jgi:dTDP-4-amino-4,6-dideoxygalactose transaminase